MFQLINYHSWIWRLRKINQPDLWSIGKRKKHDLYFFPNRLMFAGFQLQFLSKFCTWCGISFSPKRGDRVHRTCSCRNVNTWPYLLNYNLICLSLNNSATALGTLFYTSHSIKTLNNSAFSLFLASKKKWESIWERRFFCQSLQRSIGSKKIRSRCQTRLSLFCDVTKTFDDLRANLSHFLSILLSSSLFLCVQAEQS